MKLLNKFILEKLVINKDIKINDRWVLIDAPSFSNYSPTELYKFKEAFNNLDRIFEIESRDNVTGGVWMQMMLIKMSEIQTLINIFGWRKNPQMRELPEYLPLDATNKEIKDFVDTYNRKINGWNYKELKKIK